MEIWKAILNYEGLYEASNFGKIRSLKFGKVRILKPRKTKAGYLQVDLCKEGKVKMCYIHCLMWEAFIGEIPKGMQINHIDEDKTNNFIYVNPDGSVDLQKSNLNLMTCKENANWGTAIKRRAEKQINHPNESKRVVQFTLDGVLVKEWPSTRECDRNGFDHSAVGKCCNGKLKTYKGFMWATVENYYKKCI